MVVQYFPFGSDQDPAFANHINTIVDAVNTAGPGTGANIAEVQDEATGRVTVAGELTRYLYRYIHYRITSDAEGNNLIPSLAVYTGSEIYIGVNNNTSPTTPGNTFQYSPFAWAAGHNLFYRVSGYGNVNFIAQAEDTFVGGVEIVNDVGTIDTEITTAAGTPGVDGFSPVVSDNVDGTVTITRQDGSTVEIDDGAAGANSAVVFLHRVSTDGDTAPALFSGNFTYTYSSGLLTGGTLNGWTQEPPTVPQGSFLWQAQAVASNINTTDTITTAEFSTPVTVSAAGLDGVSVTIVELYQVSTDSDTAPADPTGSFRYTFSTNVLAAITTADFNGWTQTRPNVPAGSFLWLIQAAATSRTDTDDIASNEFSAVVVISGTGGNGGAGPVGARSFGPIAVYYDKSQDPGDAPLAVTVTYSFDDVTATNLALTGDADDRWQVARPTVDVDGTNSYWVGSLTINEGTNLTTGVRTGSGTGTITDITRGFLFDGVVTFTNTGITGTRPDGNSGTQNFGALAGSNAINATNQISGGTVASARLEENVSLQGNEGVLFQNETVIDGGQINTGFISTQYLSVDTALALSGPNSGFLAGRTSVSDFGTDGFYIGRTSTTGNAADGFQLSHTSIVDTSNTTPTAQRTIGDAANLFNNGTVQGIIHDDRSGLRIYSPIFYVRGSAAGSDTVQTNTGTVNLSRGDIHTITLTGGGGGGQGGAAAFPNAAGIVGNAGGNTSASLSGYSSGSYNGPNTFNASGGAQSAQRVTSSNGGNSQGSPGESTSFGVGGSGGAGGTGNGTGVPGGNAPNLSYGAGGGGGGGASTRDWRGFENSGRGEGGAGGFAGETTTFSIDLTNSNNNAILTINAVGAGGNGGAGSGNANGGRGTGGVVTVSGILDGYVPTTLDGAAATVAYGVAETIAINGFNQTVSVVAGDILTPGNTAGTSGNDRNPIARYFTRGMGRYNSSGNTTVSISTDGGQNIRGSGNVLRWRRGS